MNSLVNLIGRAAPRRMWLAAVAVCAALLVQPAIAWAHAHLSKAEPAAGSVVATSPRVIRLWFTEGPELSLTKVVLTDSVGATIRVGAAERDSAGPLVARVAILEALPSGRYTVNWSTAASDGHPSKGHFTFRVNLAEVTATATVTPPATTTALPSPVTPRSPAISRDSNISSKAINTGTEDAAASAVTPAFVVVRAVSFVALLALIGAVAFRSFVLRRIAGVDSATRLAIERTLAWRAALFAVAYVVAALVRLYLQNRMMSGDAATDAAHLRAMSMGTDWGVAWRIQLFAGAAALMSLLVARVRASLGWYAMSICAGMLAVGTTMGSHAHVAPVQPVLVSAFDFLHILAASAWMGSLFWIASVALPVIQSSPDNRARRAAALVHAFSPVALANATVVALTGFISAKYKFAHWSPLWSTTYGQVLLVKLACLAVVAAVGYHNWRRVRPTLGTDAATARLERSASIELAVGLLVIIVTAVLVATPTPV